MPFLSALLKHLYNNTHRMGKTKRNCKSVCRYRTITSLGAHRHSGLAPMTGVLQWIHPDPLRGAGQDGDQELPFLAREHPEHMEFCLGTGDEPSHKLMGQDQ